MLILLLLSNSIGSKKNLINLINVFVMKKHYRHFIVFHPQGNQTAPPNMHYSLPFQYQSKKAVLHLNHTIQLYTKSNTTMPQPQNVTNNIQAASKYERPHTISCLGDTRTKTCLHIQALRRSPRATKHWIELAPTKKKLEPPHH